ncbi:hypothetical protein HM1_2501 [Calderihabitans maritimus]|uniref:Uncharacterized protein n=1 Tax=Calderihabitans maritimus TaxID=1246530 RepID=A0A1Z5HR52_9FIRM|nr:hypothetical protein HM1_2501 [Calderihabitans maritimus]
MHVDRKREREIIGLADDIIQGIISLGMLTGVVREARQEKMVEQMAKLAEKAVVLLEGREEHLESLLEQLILQRAGNFEGFRDFKQFRRDLREVIERGAKLFRTTAEESDGRGEEDLPVTEIRQKGEIEREKAEETEPDPLPEFLRLIFPHSRIIKGYRKGTLEMDYYLPEERLALLVTNGNSGEERETLRYRHRGIRLLRIPPKAVTNPKALERIVRRAVQFF